jgi:hypothetical protein
MTEKKEKEEKSGLKFPKPTPKKKSGKFPKKPAKKEKAE